MDSLLIYESDSDSNGDPELTETEGATFHSSEPNRDPIVESFPSVANFVSPLLPATKSPTTLPPPPEDLLPPGSDSWNEYLHGGRIRSFPHVEGNYALHVYIPGQEDCADEEIRVSGSYFRAEGWTKFVMLPSYARNEVVPLIDKALQSYPGLQITEEALAQPSASDYGATETPSGSSTRLKLGREYHVSLSRTVPIRIQQIDSIISMLRHKFSSQKRYLAGFDSWEVFTNDEKTRTFLSLEITKAGLAEIQAQVALVDQVFRLHSLPSFYTNPRPHISLAWTLGEVLSSVQKVANELNKLNVKSVGGRKGILWSSQARKVDCKIGQRVYTIWASPP